MPGLPITVPRLPGWLQEGHTEPVHSNKGGVLLRLVQAQGVLGSPRIEVTAEPKRSQPSVLEEYLTRSLRDMGQLEASGQIHIQHVEQSRISLCGLPAYRVQHEFTSGHGTSQISLFQVSTFVIVRNRGVTLTAAGRTELFHPLAQSVREVLDGVEVTDTQGGGGDDEAAAGAIDLGRVGGD